MPSDPTITTQQLTSGNFTIGITDNGGGMINQMIIPGIGDISGVESDLYGRGGQSAIRTLVTNGTYNPTQAGFSKILGTQCIITSQPDKLTVEPRPCALFYTDAKYDFTQWENIGADAFNNDGGSTDLDGIDESNLVGKQEDEVKSEFDYYGIYENYLNKYGIITPAIRHYFEYRYIRNPGVCLAQFGSSSPVWNSARIQSDISSKYPDGVFQGTDKDMNYLITQWNLRNDVSIWNPAYRYVQDFFGNWTITNRSSDLAGYQNQYRQSVIIAESNDKNTGNAIGLYCPDTDINVNSVIGVNESDGSISYKDNRTITAYIQENQYRTPAMSQSGFVKHIVGLINRSRLPNGVYETYRQEYYIFYGTPQQIMDAIAKLDDGLGTKAQPQTTYFKQDFSSSVIAGNYEGVYTNLVDTILVTGASNASGKANIVEGKMNLVKSSTGNVSLARSTNIGLPSSGLFQVSMDFDCAAVSGSSNIGTPYFAIGRNIDPTNTAVLPDSNSYVKIRFSTDNTVSGNFTIGNIVNSVMVNNSNTFTGTQKITIFLNNTSNTATYLAPDGITTASISPNKMDLYVGNNLVFNEVNVNNITQAIKGFKFSLSGNNTNINLDNIVISSLNTTLPVNLLSFNGKVESNGVTLNWATASEQNSDKFELLRMDEATNYFNIVATVNAAGNSSEIRNYRAIDAKPLAGTNYYQLKQIDKDGTSKTISQTYVDNPFAISAFEVVKLADNTFQYKYYTNNEERVELSIIGLDGKVLSKKLVRVNSGYNTGELASSSLNVGLYLVRLKDSNNRVYFKKLIVTY